MSATEFTGWGAFDKNCVKDGSFKKFTYKPKGWDETDVDIKILYCGVCASDLHTASGGWNPNQDYPQVVGHEIVGIAVKVGSEVTHIKEGDLVGVGAQNDSCLECGQCKNNRESYCDKGQVGTYDGKYYREGNGKGDKSYGGYADMHRAPSHFVVKIPDGLDPAIAAPMLCGGVTVYSPLVQYGAGTTAKDVGIIGIGGLGHFGLIFAKALGANVTAISHSESKKADAEKMGATNFIATHGDDNKWATENRRTLDLIIATTNDAKMPLLDYATLLKPGGHLVFVGAPEEPLPQFPTFPLIMSNIHLTGSAIGSPKIIKEMLELAAKQDIKGWIIKRPLDDVNQVVQDMHASKARYRYVLVNEKNGGKL
ncbi:putative alcohol dehydrogenase [Leucosporidium creatinivorum]|uniref:alcohol dehydrogenase (NADP(+)) n=1 Tax=Leucosporidium creatinivorum TaxID=106004 RepID=A0A1Y2CJL2_9BASI|nr:putative alcohol dehydrogenase [Leucosporidium creatinivorum]ORY47101.1 putative alcohol dehydrogenase [Leucosporidium creatinivorum]